MEDKDMMKLSEVFVKAGNDGAIAAVNSDAFIDDLTEWTKIDEGTGDRYAHAQNNYFDKPLFDENGIANYALIDGVVVERDKTADLQKATAKARIDELKGLLQSTDYQAIKFAEGEMSAEEFAPVKAQRRQWRTEINALENNLQF